MRISGHGRLMQRSFLDDYDENGGRGGGSSATVREGTAGPPGGGLDSSSMLSAEHYQSAGFASAPPRGTLEEYERQHPHHVDRFSWFVMKLTVTAALGGFLFGYDTGVISGAMLLIADDFGLDDIQEEIIVSITIAAAVTAALAGGPGMERLGRRPVILAAAVVFTVGAVLLAAAPSYRALVLGRLIVGLGIGLASLATPVYIAEAAPSHVRGRLVTLNTLFITMGQVVAGVVDGLFAQTTNGWRYMLGLSGVPSFFMAVGFL